MPVSLLSAEKNFSVSFKKVKWGKYDKTETFMNDFKGQVLQ